MIALTQITNTDIFALIVSESFKRYVTLFLAQIWLSLPPL